MPKRNPAASAYRGEQQGGTSPGEGRVAAAAAAAAAAAVEGGGAAAAREEPHRQMEQARGGHANAGAPAAAAASIGGIGRTTASDRASAAACVAAGLLALVLLRWWAHLRGRAACAQLLAAYYGAFSPEKLRDGSVDEVLQAYGADQGALRAALEGKYGALGGGGAEKQE
jgi:hypothetical protein